jgi:hypothetical protein
VTVPKSVIGAVHHVVGRREQVFEMLILELAADLRTWTTGEAAN